MNILIFCLFWFIGILVTSFTLVSILIILFFGIPFTKKLEKTKLLKSNNGIIHRYFISLILLAFIFLIVFKLIQFFIPNALLGFIIGGIAALFISLNKIGQNPDNIKDYVETNKKFFTVDEKDLQF